MGDVRTDLPSGLVTFVFTDIEGSTRLIHRLGDRYLPLLDAHRSIVRSAAEQHGGVVISADGDGSFLAFWSPAAAISACVAAQRGLGAADWPDSPAPRVRMGIHTGMAWPHGGDYIALAVSQAARVMAAAHGGQILVSQPAIDAVGEGHDWVLESRGRFRVRDFDGPLTLYQVTAAGLASEFPAVRALPTDGHNIVPPLTPTIGREGVIAQVVDLLGPGSLVTLVGPGGVGKTRVAAEVGMQVAPQWNDGVWLVDLAPVSEGRLVAPAIAEAVGAPRRPASERWDDVVEHLRERDAVVILDNAEHLLGTCRTLVSGLLAECRGVGVLATSREPIRLAGEMLRPIEPLSTPAQGSDPGGVLSFAAARLFADRGSAVRPGFVIDRTNALAVADICRRLDGLPLFIELAAANLAVQSAAEILAGLEDRFRLLQARHPAVSERHRTVDGVLGWSYRLLSEDEQTAFRRLSVFGSSFNLETATAAIGIDRDPVDVPNLVWSLVDRSLVTADLGANATRYRLLETVRRYGRGLLDEAGETVPVVEALVGHFLDRLGPWLPSDARWVGEVGVEIGNLRSLIQLIPAQSQETAQQLACTIGRFHDSTHAFGEGIEELTGYADSLREPTATRSSMLATLAYLHLRTGEVEAAEQLVETAQVLRDQHGAPEWDEVGVERTRGEVARRKGDLAAAVRIATTALQRPMSDRGRSRMFNLLGTSSAALGDFAMAYEACARELELNQKLGYEEFVASAHGNLAEVALRRDDLASAAAHQRACLDLATAQGSEPMVAFSMLVAARIAAARADWSTAVRLQARGEAMLNEVGLALYEDDRRQLDDLAALAHAALGDALFSEAGRGGSGLRLSEAVELAQTVLAPTP